MAAPRSDIRLPRKRMKGGSRTRLGKRGWGRTPPPSFCLLPWPLRKYETERRE